jgi:hypothetical protein
MQPTRDRSTPDPSEYARSNRAKSRPDRSGPLPQFAFPLTDALDGDRARDAIDPDKTLEPLPAWGRTRAASASSEIEAVDILEEVPVARRPAWRSASATQEVQIRDILEVMDASVPLRRAMSLAPLEAPLPAVPHAAPAPVARDLAPAGPRPRADSSLRVEWEEPAPPRRRARALVAAGLLALVVVLGVALARRGESRAIASQGHPESARLQAAPAAMTAASETSSRPLPASAANANVPMVSVDSLPRPSTGTVIGSPGHRLFIDGNVARGFSAVVRCGAHVVQVGSAGKARSVDVPCGADVYVR